MPPHMFHSVLDESACNEVKTEDVLGIVERMSEMLIIVGVVVFCSTCHTYVSPPY